MALKDTDKGSWSKFIELCTAIESISSRLSKTELVKKFVSKFDGDLKVLLHLLLPKETQRRYQMNRKRMLKLFASIFNEDERDLHDLMTSGNTAGKLCETISHCFTISTVNLTQKNKSSVLSMKEIDDVLQNLTTETRESSQQAILSRIVQKCTALDLKWFIREIDRDLKINAGTKAVLDGVDEKAYDTYKIKASLDYIVNKLAMNSTLTVSSVLMTPIKPMLAAACKSYEEAFEKCVSPIVYAEIKYDGERVQVHFDGTTWKFYSRSLKEVAAYKIKEVEESVTKSMPNAKSLILDSEIIMISTKTGKLLPFTSLGKHKRNQFGDEASPCLFVFDLLYINGKCLIEEPLSKRREILEQELKEIQYKIQLSKLTIVKDADAVQELMEKAIEENQEGLVLKDSAAKYIPAGRKWLKMKKDYLFGGAMADSCDLCVLGAYKGHGKHGGKYSTFLMGSLDPSSSKFVTVCKAHNGLSDEQIDDFTNTLSMIEYDDNNPPQWLSVSNSLKPDWIVRNPKKSPIFEITGFEFSESSNHTATDNNGKGFSIRFPRVTRIRDDKKYKDATNLDELRNLVQVSRDDPSSALQRANGNNTNTNNNNGDKKQANPKKRKQPSPNDQQPTIMDMLQPAAKKRKVNTSDSGENENADIDMDDNTNSGQNGNVNANGVSGKAEDEDDEDADIDMDDNTNSSPNGNVNANGVSGKAEDEDDEDDDEKNDDEDVNMLTKLAVNAVNSPPPMNNPVTSTVDQRPVCKYDLQCYRQKVSHFQEYQHPKREAKEANEVRTMTKSKVEPIAERKEKIEKAASINREKQLNAKKEEMEEAIAAARKKYEELSAEIEEQYKKNLEKAESEYNEKLLTIKQEEAFSLERIEKKFHPDSQ
eukprot:CAMPEP_0197073090 /NCGR_PEP_ID=MMETSP1384-20130603/210427_1 /TAXON_ID=29189 /ORGANISM="Ammonia sp." /LENGTH=876 /DNA_ID=CAMNT_0042511915 /DNA_START=8 /DNA_END=2639 /DNA_ORIENTATION=+